MASEICHSPLTENSSATLPIGLEFMGPVKSLHFLNYFLIIPSQIDILGVGYLNIVVKFSEMFAFVCRSRFTQIKSFNKSKLVCNYIKHCYSGCKFVKTFFISAKLLLTELNCELKDLLWLFKFL